MTVRELIVELEKIENKELEVKGCSFDNWDDVTKVSIETVIMSDQVTQEDFCELKIGDWH